MGVSGKTKCARLDRSAEAMAAGDTYFAEWHFFSPRVSVWDPMKALRYFFCVVLPPVAVLMTGRIMSFILSLFLTLLGWVPGVIHACLVVNDYQAEHRR
jgi:uncharacterized membrane protein YqaE (UPF0057 family)